MDFVELNLLGSDYKQVAGSCKESIDRSIDRQMRELLDEMSNRYPKWKDSDGCS